jgi:hypothetical protein
VATSAPGSFHGLVVSAAKRLAAPDGASFRARIDRAQCGFAWAHLALEQEHVARYSASNPFVRKLHVFHAMTPAAVNAARQSRNGVNWRPLRPGGQANSPRSAVTAAVLEALHKPLSVRESRWLARVYDGSAANAKRTGKRRYGGGPNDPLPFIVGSNIFTFEVPCWGAPARTAAASWDRC